MQSISIQSLLHHGATSFLTLTSDSSEKTPAVSIRSGSGSASISLSSAGFSWKEIELKTLESLSHGFSWREIELKTESLSHLWVEPCSCSVPQRNVIHLQPGRPENCCRPNFFFLHIQTLISAYM